MPDVVPELMYPRSQTQADWDDESATETLFWGHLFRTPNLHQKLRGPAVQVDPQYPLSHTHGQEGELVTKVDFWGLEAVQVVHTRSWVLVHGVVWKEPAWQTVQLRQADNPGTEA